MTPMRTDGIGNQTRVSSWQRIKRLALPAIAGSIAGFVGGVVAQPALHSYFERRSISNRRFEACVDGKPTEIPPQQIQFTCDADKHRGDWKLVGLRRGDNIIFMHHNHGLTTSSYTISKTGKIEQGLAHPFKCRYTEPGDGSDAYAFARGSVITSVYLSYGRPKTSSADCVRALVDAGFAMKMYTQQVK